MNKFLTKIIGASLAIAMMIGGAVGVNTAKEAKRLDATPGDSPMTSVFNSKSWGISSGDGWTSTTDGYAFDNSRGVQVTKGNTGVAVSNESYTNISNINVTAGTASKATATISVKVGNGTAKTWNISKNTPNTAHDFAFSPTETGNVTLSVSATGASAYCSQIVITYTSGGQQQGPTALANPNPQYNESTRKVTWTTDAHATKYQIKVDSAENFEDISITPNPEYDASGLATGVQHTVQIKAVGDETNYSSATGSVQFTPTAPFVGKVYGLCTSVDELEVGASYIITNGIADNVKTMATTDNADNRPATDVTVSNSKITSTQATLTLTLGGEPDDWTFQTENYLGTDGYFSPSTGDNNKLRVIASASTCTISFNNNSAAIITFSSNSYGRNIIRYNGLFSCYASGQSPVYLWKEYKTLSSLEVTGTPTKLTGYYNTQKFDPTGITVYQANYTDAPSRTLPASVIKWPSLTTGMTSIKGSFTEFGKTVYTPEYTISVAEDSLSTIALSGEMVNHYYMDESWDKGDLIASAVYLSGQQTVVTNQATFAYYKDSALTTPVATPADLGAGANQTVYVKATYSSVSNSVGYAQTVTVEIEHGTVSNDPLSADDAIAIGALLTNKTETTKQYYVSGVISSIYSNNLNDASNCASFYLEENDNAYDFEAYQIKPAQDCTNYSDLLVGAEVVIRCTIKKYNSTIENGTTASLLSISYTTPSLTGVSLNKNSLVMGIGSEETLTASALPLGAELGAVSWSTSNNQIADVDQDGKVTAIAQGSATITASAGGFESSCSVTVSLTREIDLSVDDTTSASDSALVWDYPDVFKIEDAKGSGTKVTNYYPGTEGKSYSLTRFYANNVISVAPYPTTRIVQVIFVASSASDATKLASSTYTNATAVANASRVTISVTNPLLPFSITVGDKSDFIEIKVFYQDANANEVVTRTKTNTQLSYHYSGNAQDGFVYSNISIRFGGIVDKNVWSELDTNNHLITGFGVMIADGEMVKNDKDFADAIELATPASVSTDVSTEYAVDYFVPVANMASTIGDDGDNYFWNLRWSIDSANMDKMYSAVAYIKVGDEYVVMNMARESVETMATKYVASGNYSGTVADSLQYIVDSIQQA